MHSCRCLLILILLWLSGATCHGGSANIHEYPQHRRIAVIAPRMSESTLTPVVASLLDLNLEWYSSINETLSLNTDHFAGLLANIPNGDDEEEALNLLEKASREAETPIIVFANGVHHAKRLGLNSVVYDQVGAGTRMAEELEERQASHILSVKCSNDDPDITFERLAGLVQSLGNKVHVKTIQPDTSDSDNHTESLGKMLRDDSKYDSIVALGTSSADVVAKHLMSSYREDYHDVLVGLFNTENSNVKELFHNHQNTFAISNIPEISSLTALFTMYLQVTRGLHPFVQHTIYIDPIVIDNATLSRWDGSSCWSYYSSQSVVGIVTPCDDNEDGIFEQVFIAGATDLAQRLKWHVTTKYHSGKTGSLRKVIHALAKSNVRGVIALLREDTCQEQCEDVSFTTNDVPVVTTTIKLRPKMDARSIANRIITSGLKTPICIFESSDHEPKELCTEIYRAYSRLQAEKHVPTTMEQFVHAFQLSRVSSLYRDISETFKSLDKQDLVPDMLVITCPSIYHHFQKHTLSRRAFDIIRAFTDDSQDNGYAAGYFAMLDILFSKDFVFKPRSLSNLVVSTSAAMALLQQDETVSHLGLAEERSQNLYRDPASWWHSTLLFSILHPLMYQTVFFSGWLNKSSTNMCVFARCIVAAVLSILLCKFIWRRAKIAAAKRDLPWLLSYKELVKSPLSSWRYISADSSPSVLSMSNMPWPSPSVGLLLGENDHATTSSTIHAVRGGGRSSVDSEQLRSSAGEGTSSNCPSSSSVSSQSASSQRSAASAPIDYFPIARPRIPSCMYKPKNGTGSHVLERFIGINRNLPVYVKQIGLRSSEITDQVCKEVSLMKNARHSKLVEFVGLCIEPHGVYVVEEYCSKGSLAEVLSNPDINLTWIFRFSLIHDLLQGLEFLHRSKFRTHGLLTSHSCMVTGRWELKITDFGLTGIRQSQYKTKLRKTNEPLSIVCPTERLLWLAPESIVEKAILPESTFYTHPTRAADVYSAGIIMNEIVSRQKPYQRLLEHEHLSIEAIFHGIRKKGWRPDMLQKSDDEYVEKLTAVITACLESDPDCRPSLAAIRSRLRAIDPSATGYENVVDNLAILLERYASDMEELVRRRTANLQQRTLELEEERARTQNLLIDLERAKNEAEAAASSKQEFLANMSHEIRTPMNAVIGMSRILMESNLPPDLHDCAETIESSGNHLMTIIDDILDFSKIESGKLTLEHQKLELTYTIESALKLVSPNFVDKQIVLWYDIDPEVSTSVGGDVVRIRQVLLNLLSNALKFTQDGYVRIHLKKIGGITCAPTSPLGGLNLLKENRKMQTLQFSVTDTGIGIPKDKLDLLFQTFHQVDASTTRNYGGTGLGLAISQRLCRMMGGDMWVETEYGKGSTFYFRIVLELQADSQTFGTLNHLKELSATCKHAMVISEKPWAQLAWQHILSAATLPNILTTTYVEAQEHFKNSYLPSVLIIDEDFESITDLVQDEPSSSECSSRTVTSYVIRKALCKQFTAISAVPVVYVKDLRRQRREQSPILGSSRIMQDSSASPTEEFASEEINTACVTKPIKNSKLYTILRRLTAGTTTESRRSTPSPATDIRSTRQRSNTSISSASQMSVGRPLAEIAGGARSLLVDDNAVNQKVVERMLHRLGVQPQVANNGKEACDMIQEAQKTDKPYDLVFMDVWMPEMNGLEASKYIRQHITRSHTHPYIIAMTACAVPGDRDKCIAAGMNSYVSKPVKKDELEAALHTYSQVILGEMMSDSSSSSSSSSENVAVEKTDEDRKVPKVVISSENIACAASTK